MLAVTSFGPAGWAKYAREGLETFVAHWPGPIVAFYEQNPPELSGTLKNAVNTGKLELRDLLNERDLLNVLGWCAHVPIFRGMTEDGRYNYHRDIWKFCRKTFAVRAAAGKCSGPLFWLDADVRLTEDLPVSVLEQMISDGPITYLGRRGAPHSECGFIGFNGADPEVQTFIRRWAGAYVDGSVLGLPGWHDCWVFDALMKQMGINGNDLGIGVSNGNSAEAIFEKTILGQYGTHLKGARKGSKAA